MGDRAEGQVGRGDMPVPSRVKQLKTFSDLTCRGHEGGGQGAGSIE